ncbi:MAG: RNA polymerase sigma factor [Phycisphaerales bacterium JB054]
MRAGGGDREAFAVLYRRHVSMVHGVVLARLGRAGRSEAEDVTQEVFVVAWRRLGELRDGAAVGAWLVSIARSRAADWARASGRRSARELVSGGAAGSEVSGRDPRTDEVLAMVWALPEKYREVLVLRFVVGMTGGQIGMCLRMSPGAVRVNLHRGVGRLRAAMAEGAR